MEASKEFDVVDTLYLCQSLKMKVNTTFLFLALTFILKKEPHDRDFGHTDKDAADKGETIRQKMTLIMNLMLVKKMQSAEMWRQGST